MNYQKEEYNGERYQQLLEDFINNCKLLLEAKQIKDILLDRVLVKTKISETNQSLSGEDIALNEFIKSGTQLFGADWVKAMLSEQALVESKSLEEKKEKFLQLLRKFIDNGEYILMLAKTLKVLENSKSEEEINEIQSRLNKSNNFSVRYLLHRYWDSCTDEAKNTTICELVSEYKEYYKHKLAEIKENRRRLSAAVKFVNFLERHASTNQKRSEGILTQRGLLKVASASATQSGIALVIEAIKNEFEQFYSQNVKGEE